MKQFHFLNQQDLKIGVNGMDFVRTFLIGFSVVRLIALEGEFVEY